MVAVFESEADALRAVRELVAANQPAYPSELALLLEDEEGESTLVARGANLASRARHVR
jgi:hypothetical protein